MTPYLHGSGVGGVRVRSMLRFSKRGAFSGSSVLSGFSGDVNRGREQTVSLSTCN